MPDSMARLIAEFQQMTTAQLREQWRRIMGAQPRCGNRVWLYKRLCWTVQAKKHGGLSARAKGRLEELLTHVEQWLPANKPQRVIPPSVRDRTPTLPAGTVLTRIYKGQTLWVLIREDGRFEFDGSVYPSLTAIAKAVTGSHWNGRHFFFVSSSKRGSA